MTDYDKGVSDALKPLTFEEANLCGFLSPYSAVVKDDPLKKLFELRRKRLAVQLMDEVTK